MSEINVEIKNGASAQVPAPVTVGDALKRLDRELAKQLKEADLPVIEKRMRDIAKRNLSYRREEIPKAEALRIFEERNEPLKCQLVADKGGDTVSVYYIDGSPFIDFCVGPHVPNTN